MITPSFALTATERVLPKLALDFTTASLDSRVTFTRSGNTATVINSSGVIQTVNADIPRFDYTLNTGGACKGLLIEESRSNILTYSQSVGGTDWNKVNFGLATIPVITTNYATAPDGTTTASRIEMSLGGGTTTSDYAIVQHNVITVTSGATYTASIYLKSNTGSNYTVLYRDDFFAGGTTALWTVTPTWQRFSITVSAASTSAYGMKLWLRGALGTSATADILAWGAQYELGAFVTSFIPTVATVPITRNADVASMTGTNFSSWYNATEGTFYGEGVPLNLATYSPGELSNGNYDKRMLLGISGTALRVYYQTPNTSSQINSPTAVVGGLYKQVASYSNTGVSFTANKATAVSSTAWVDSNACNTLRIGATFGAAGNNYVRKINYYPLRLTNAELQSVTA